MRDGDADRDIGGDRRNADRKLSGDQRYDQACRQVQSGAEGEASRGEYQQCRSDSREAVQFVNIGTFTAAKCNAAWANVVRTTEVKSRAEVIAREIAAVTIGQGLTGGGCEIRAGQPAERNLREQ